MKTEAKYALLRVLIKEQTELTGRFLNEEEQLRVLSLSEEIERLEYELEKLELQGD